MLSWRHAPSSTYPARRRPAGTRAELAFWGVVVAGGLLLAACSRGPATLADVTETADLSATATADDSAVPDAGLPTATPVFGTADVTPAEVALGGVTVSLSLAPPRHMVDQTMLQATDPAQQQQALLAANTGALAGDQAKAPLVQGTVVLTGMTHVTNNIDAAQAAPLDTAQAAIRHVAVKVLTKDTRQPVPYLTLTMDVLLDGRPISYEQSVLPMLVADAPAGELYYGNNVRFGPPGTYQVFVRVQRSPFLGKDQPQAALFNIVLNR